MESFYRGRVRLAVHGYTLNVRFDPLYVSNVLRENFKDARALFFHPLLSIHYAHLAMLTDCGIVNAAEARQLRDALDSISAIDAEHITYDAGLRGSLLLCRTADHQRH